MLCFNYIIIKCINANNAVITLIIMVGSKTLFCSSNFQWTRERIYSKFIDTLGAPSQNVRRPRPRRWWVDDIKMDATEVGRGDVDWVRLIKDREKRRTIVKIAM